MAFDVFQSAKVLPAETVTSEILTAEVVTAGIVMAEIMTAEIATVEVVIAEIVTTKSLTAIPCYSNIILTLSNVNAFLSNAIACSCYLRLLLSCTTALLTSSHAKAIPC